MLGTKGTSWASLSNNVWQEHEKVALYENEPLIITFIEEEIKAAIFKWIIIRP